MLVLLNYFRIGLLVIRAAAAGASGNLGKGGMLTTLANTCATSDFGLAERRPRSLIFPGLTSKSFSLIDRPAAALKMAELRCFLGSPPAA